LRFQFSPNSSPIPGYDPANPVVAPNQWHLYTPSVPASDTRPAFSPFATLTSPARKFTRIAMLMDAVATNAGLVMEDVIDAFKDEAQYQWRSGTAQGAKNQLENGTLTPSVMWVYGRGVYVPQEEATRINAQSPGVNVPNLQRVPSDITF